MKPDAVIFDLDGVLTDTSVYHARAWAELVRAEGVEPPEDLEEQVKGISRIASLRIALGERASEYSEEELTELAGRKNDQYLKAVEAIGPADLGEGTLELFADLKKAGIRIALGSASRNARVVLEGLEILEWFDAVSDGHTHERGKPHPDVFLGAAAMLGTNPSRCLVVEDAAAGIDAALRGGFVAVGIGNPDTLSHAHLLISSLTQISADSLTELYIDYRRPTLTGPQTPRAIQVPSRGEIPLDATGDHPVWQDLPWHDVTKVGTGTLTYKTRFKTLRNETGLAFLVDCEDRKLHCTDMKDQDPLFTEDVVEIFLQPDSGLPVYLEFEISPLNAEVVIRITNTAGRFRGWEPWRQPEDDRVRHSVRVRGGEQKPGADVEGWTAEILFPWSQFIDLPNGCPQSGEEWRGNIYRIDTDPAGTTHWAWDPRCGTNFHDINGFGRLLF